MEDDRPIVPVDHHSAEFAADPWSVYRDLRQRCPVAYSDAHGGFWMVSKYDDVRRVALDDHTFSSAASITVPPKPPGKRLSIPIEMDPPLFQEYRRVLNPMFAPARVAQLEPEIRSFVHGAIDGFIESGECDLIHDFANPVPAMTTLLLLGLPPEDWELYAWPVHAQTFLRPGSERRQAAVEPYAAIHDRVREEIEARKRSPRDDMISALLQAEVAGKRIDDEEVLDIIMLTLHGGFDTTGSAISNALVYLDQHPDDRRRLMDDPDLVPQAVEEFLRYEAPQQGLARVTTRECVVGGQRIDPGERIMLWWASANRDEEAFPDPDTVVLDRFPNRHVTFGVGAHRCLGSTVARRQIHFALEAFLDRLPDYRVHHDRIERAETVGVVFGHFSIPISFTPGSRRTPTGDS